MAPMVKDSFLDLERHRQLLESNIEKLQKSLQHWQTWEAEYEGLKEEILGATPSPTRAELVDLARGYEGELVTQKEVADILGPSSRTATQVVTLLDHRIDYVEQNVKTVQKQLLAAENKLAAATIISTPDVRNEEGLPLTEIVEELDDDGNVISSHLSTPGSVKPQLLEVLKKAGVADLPPQGSSSASAEKPPSSSLDRDGIPATDSNSNWNPQPPKPIKKGVKFAEDTKDSPEQKKSQTAKRLEEIMRIAKQSEESQETPIIPTDESAEDAALRREMLQYGALEIGAVVAELELEEGSDWSDEDYDDAMSTDEEEDQFGRSTKSILDDELRQQMIELEEKLGARMLENIGKKASDTDIGRVTISGKNKGSALKDDSIENDPREKATTDLEFPASATISKKSVRFSENLDISPGPQQVSAPPSASQQRLSAPISDIVEREISVPVPVTIPPVSKKNSKFKSERAAGPRIVNGPLANKANASSLPLMPLKSTKPKPFSQPITFASKIPSTPIAPSGLEGMTLAPTVVERVSAPEAVVAEPDEMDPQLLHQEVATEYHRMRNRMIQRQGGFMKEEENEIIPLTEEEGGPKKVSRFKAARLARS